MPVQYTGSQDVSTNQHHTLSDSDKAPYMMSLQAQGNACWDAAYYLEHHPDLEEAGYNLSTAWEHFVEHGQFENRVERYEVKVCLLFVQHNCYIASALHQHDRSVADCDKTPGTFVVC